MARMIVELNDDEIKAAICEWAEKHHGMKPDKVNVRAENEWIGYGTGERQVPVVKISFET